MKLEMRHTEQSIYRLARVQYDTYCIAQKMVAALFAAALIVLGTFGFFGRSTSLVLIAIGCWSFMGLNAPANRNAKRMLECAKGDLPVSVYTFDQDALTIQGDGQQEKLDYTDIYSLIWDGAYLYLFLNRYSAYMVPLETRPEKEAEELKQLLTEKTGHPLEKPGGLLSVDLRTLRRRLAGK